MSLSTSLALAAGIWLAPLAAHAQPTVAADVDVAIPLDEEYASTGGGFAIRAGHQFDGHAAALTPELGFSYASFRGEYAPRVYRGMAGFRFGIGEILRPGVFAHAGVARISLDVPTGTPDPSHSAFSYDVGAFLDFTLIPFLNIGVHGAYNRITENDEFESFRWVTVGAQAAFIF